MMPNSVHQFGVRPEDRSGLQVLAVGGGGPGWRTTRSRLLLCAALSILISGCGGSNKPAQQARPFALGVVGSFNPADLSYQPMLGDPNGGVRITFYWMMIEPSPGTWNYNHYDEIVATAKSSGIPLIGILAYSVKWASPTDPNLVDPSSISYYPPNPSDFVNYAQTLVSRYPSIQSWEVWNEPNNSIFWLPTPDVVAYTQLLQQTYTAIKTLNPEAKVILGGLTPGPPTSSDLTSVNAEDFLSGVYQNGGTPYFDLVGFHPYNHGVDPDAYLAAAMTDLHNTMLANGDSARQILVTELGWYTGTAPGAVSELTQADYLTRAFDILYSEDFVAGFYWYHLKDHTDTPQPANPELNYGLIRWDGTARPAASSFRALASP